MIVYFMRHASAGSKLPNALKDERRPLDEQGTLQARSIGRLLAAMQIQVDHIISSPLTRALETASLVGNEMAHQPAVRMEEALRPGGDYAGFKNMLSTYRKYDSIMVVGHNPNESEFLSKIVSSGSAPAQIQLKKGAIAKVDLKGGGGTLEWLVTPKIAGALAAVAEAGARQKASRK
jgi:phosphohistidine phosphatase